jgi:transposase
MELKEKQYKWIKPLLPKQRGNVKIDNQTLLNALIYICENGCKWRALPEKFGPWHSIYVRLNRWAANGVLERVFTALQADGLVGMGVFSLDSTSVKVHPDAHGAQKKRQAGDRQFAGRL